MPDSFSPDTPAPLTTEREQEIRAREAAVSRGPWSLAYENCDCSEYDDHGIYVSRINTGAGPATELRDLPNAEWELMVHARQDVPALLAEIDRLRAERDLFANTLNGTARMAGRQANEIERLRTQGGAR